MITLAYLFFWEENLKEEYYFTSFIRHHFGEVKIVNIDDNPDILLVSVLGGNISIVKNYKAKIKLFFTGENTAYNPYHYQFNDDKTLKENFDIIVGFKYSNIRFPLWITYYKYLDYKEDEDNILKHIQESYNKNIKKEKKFLTTLLSHNDSYQNNIRPFLYSIMSTYKTVICASTLFNNYPTIGNLPSDKIDHISESVFNICPENSYGEGYITEKIIHALEAGTIPIYWASEYPESNIINKNKYIFCDSSDSIKIQKTIDDAVNNKEIRQSYIDGDVFTKDAGIHIKKFYDDLKNNIKQQLDEKNIPYDYRI